MSSELPPGLYEQVVNRALSSELEKIEADRKYLVEIDGVE